MSDYVGRRILNSAISLIGLIVLVFFLARLTGTPTSLYLPPDATIEMRQDFAERHGFNDPAIVQFGRFLADLVVFDFGESLRQRRPALDLVLDAFPTTLLLAVISMVLALVTSILTGALAAYRPGGFFDRVTTVISLAGVAVPNFWIALVGILIFSVTLRLVPTSGTGTVAHWILPVAVLFVRPAGLLAQVVRGSMLSALTSEYVKTARAKGVRERSIIFVHVLRNALLPVITVASDQAAAIIAGAVIVETIFGFPGIGKLLIDSISFRDFAVVQATILISALAIFAMNICIDILYGLLDPRIRFS